MTGTEHDMLTIRVQCKTQDDVIQFCGFLVHVKKQLFDSFIQLYFLQLNVFIQDIKVNVRIVR